jgi:hypothetical protein
MPKPYTMPTLIDNLNNISIFFLCKHEYLKPNQNKSGTITWSRNGQKTGSISITVNTQTESPYLELDYKCNDVPINYRVQLISAPSNLGKGFVWFFICPHTGKRCRKLYLVNTYFYHYTAYSGCMYEKQTQSKKNRDTIKIYGVYFDADNNYKQLYKKHFKKYYAGKPTKKYLKITQQIQKAGNVSYLDIERALLS